VAENEERDHASDYRLCTQRFIALANTMKDEGLELGLVSQAIMSASGVYATYAIAGNEGGLNQSGVDKLVELYKASLEEVQLTKKQKLSEG
jgi:hypothetical protein